MRLLGLDPGLQRTGWGLIAARGNALHFVAAGIVTTDPADALAVRLDALYRGLQEVVARHRPTAAAVEETVVNVNADSSLKLGHARGVVLLAAAHAGLDVTEYASKTVKRAVVGTGGAQKRQVAMMVRMLLPGSGRISGDAADALAVALCHAHHHAAQTRLRDALARAPAAGTIGR
jgi:crossover junction endodeoxyribonuclease RuvC